jgi:hypothetical protein
MGVRRTARAIAAGFVVAALALAGCAPADTAGGPVTLEFLAWGSNIDKRIEVWNQAHPDVQVTISAPACGPDFPVRVLTAVRAGEGPDIADHLHLAAVAAERADRRRADRRLRGGPDRALRQAATRRARDRAHRVVRDDRRAADLQ